MTDEQADRGKRAILRCGRVQPFDLQNAELPKPLGFVAGLSDVDLDLLSVRLHLYSFRLWITLHANRGIANIPIRVTVVPMPETPTEVVETTFGPVTVYASSERKVSLEAGRTTSGRYDKPPLLINRVEYGMRTELEMVPDAREGVGGTAWKIGHNTLRVKPMDWKRMNDYPSEAARTKIRIVWAEVAQWLDAHPEFLHEAGEVQHEREIARLDADIRTAEAALAELRNRREVLVAAG